MSSNVIQSINLATVALQSQAASLVSLSVTDSGLAIKNAPDQQFMRRFYGIKQARGSCLSL